MRIVAGAFKGRRLVTPRGHSTRPTADQVRIALMDTLAPRLPRARVLDLFAGAGGVALEALSRGAAAAVLVERDARAAAAARANVQTLGVGGAARVMQTPVAAALGALARAGERFDVVFLDPPYDTTLVTATLAALGDGAVLGAGAIVVAQHFTKQRPPAEAGRLRAYRTRRFGETTLTFFRAADYDSGSAAPPRED